MRLAAFDQDQIHQAGTAPWEALKARVSAAQDGKNVIRIIAPRKEFRGERGDVVIQIGKLALPRGLEPLFSP